MHSPVRTNCVILGSVPSEPVTCHCLTNKKSRCYPPIMRSPSIRLPGCAEKWPGSIGLGLNGRIRSDEMTRFIYALKEIRACLEAEILTDVQQRLVLLSRDMDNKNGHRVLHQPTVAGG